MGSIVFIDTNIWLDFYRVRTREKALSILAHICPDTHGRFITTAQVEMEFKKNRQRVILASYAQVKPPGFESLRDLPAFLADSKQSSGLQTSERKVRQLTITLKARIGRVLREPTKHDQVYKVAQRLFKCDSPHNLARDQKVRFEIRRLARKRFILGYPPRKDNDTSIGDSVNWEWIIRCAKESGDDVVIVSRDSDYGVRFEDNPMINDWLTQEFRERVSRKRKLVLTDRLTEGLRAAGIKVSKSEEQEEVEFLKEERAVRNSALNDALTETRPLSLADFTVSSRPPGAFLADAIARLERQSKSREWLSQVDESHPSFTDSRFAASLAQIEEALAHPSVAARLEDLQRKLSALPDIRSLEKLVERNEYFQRQLEEAMQREGRSLPPAPPAASTDDVLRKDDDED